MNRIYSRKYFQTWFAFGCIEMQPFGADMQTVRGTVRVDWMLNRQIAISLISVLVCEHFFSLPKSSTISSLVDYDGDTVSTGKVRTFSNCATQHFFVGFFVAIRSVAVSQQIHHATWCCCHFYSLNREFAKSRRKKTANVDAPFNILFY